MKGLRLLGATALAACVLDPTGARCLDDSNCPRSQFCDVSGTCRRSGRAASLSLSPADLVVVKGASAPISAMATIGGFNRDVTTQASWTADATTVSVASGRVDGRELGSATLTASFDGIEASARVTVIPAVLQNIQLSPENPQVPVGARLRLIATGTYSNGEMAEITSLAQWASSNDAAAAVSNLPGARGEVTGLQQGRSVNVSASLGGVSGSTVVSVVAPALVEIELSPLSATVAVGTTQQFVATGTFTDLSTRDISSLATWASAAADVARVSRGVATGLIAGSTTISAELDGVSARAILAVTNASVASIALSPVEPSIARDTVQSFHAVATFSDNTTQDVTSLATWESLQPAVASVSNVAGTKGNATGLSTGTATIRATLAARSGSTTLTVTGATLSSISVTPVNPTLAKGTSVQFLATGLYSDNTTQDLTAASTWSSSASGVVSVSNAAGTKGLARADGVGSATVTAQVSGRSGTSSVTVSAATLSAITVAPPSTSIAHGTTRQFTATGSYSDSSMQDLTEVATWSSSAPAVASVSNASGSKGIASGLDAGSATIVATHDMIAGQATLTVTVAALTSISITPPNPSVPKGTSRQLTATGQYSDGSSQDLTTRVVWSSSDPQKATVSNAVDSKGLLSALNVGVTTVSATLGNVVGSTPVTVTGGTLQSIALTPMNPTIPRMGQQQFTATGNYSDGTMQPLTAAATWSSSNPSVAAISNAMGFKGRASAMGPGSTIITATHNGVSGQTTLTVSP